MPHTPMCLLPLSNVCLCSHCLHDHPSHASEACQLILFFLLCYAATAYMIILGDCFQPLLEGHFGQVGAD